MLSENRLESGNHHQLLKVSLSRHTVLKVLSLIQVGKGSRTIYLNLILQPSPMLRLYSFLTHHTGLCVSIPARLENAQSHSASIVSEHIFTIETSKLVKQIQRVRESHIHLSVSSVPLLGSDMIGELELECAKDAYAAFPLSSKLESLRISTAFADRHSSNSSTYPIRIKPFADALKMLDVTFNVWHPAFRYLYVCQVHSDNADRLHWHLLATNTIAYARADVIQYSSYQTSDSDSKTSSQYAFDKSKAFRIGIHGLRVLREFSKEFEVWDADVTIGNNRTVITTKSSASHVPILQLVMKNDSYPIEALIHADNEIRIDRAPVAYRARVPQSQLRANLTTEIGCVYVLIEFLSAHHVNVYPIQQLPDKLDANQVIVDTRGFKSGLYVIDSPYITLELRRSDDLECVIFRNDQSYPSTNLRNLDVAIATVDLQSSHMD